MVTCVASPAPWPEGLRGSAGVRGGAADVLIYYFTELLLSDKGSLGPSRLASMEHIFNMNRKRNNKNIASQYGFLSEKNNITLCCLQ